MLPTFAILFLTAWSLTEAPAGFDLADTNAPRLEAVTFASAPEGTRLVRLHFTGRVTAFSDPEPSGEGTLQVKLYNVRKADGFQGDEPLSPVSAYRTRSERGHILLELRIDGPVLGDVYRDGSSHDLFVALAPVQGAVITESRSTGTAAPAPVLVAETPRDSSPANNLAVAEAASRWRLDRIAIDAGHGGKDPGAIGAGRVREKDVVLPVALKLGKYLEELLGVEVVYTRSDDRFVELRERGRIANRVQADLFVSIHANNAANRAAHGTETYFLGMNKEGPAQAVIERENSVIQMETDQAHYDQFDQAALIRLQLAQSAFLRKSEELASRIEHQFEQRVQRVSRGVKEGNFQVLWAAAMPAVLVELGFISNADEARFLQSAEGVDYMASAIFRAIRDYKVAYEQSLLTAVDD